MSTVYISNIAGNLLGGAGIVINLITLWTYGLPSIKNAIFSDKDRQILLTLFCLCGQVTSVPISVYQNTGAGQSLIVASIVMFLSILYGLTLVVHNSFVRLYVAVSTKVNLKSFNQICCILYILPFVAYTPYWILIVRYWNSPDQLTIDPLFYAVWEPVLFAAVVGTEAVALLSDFILVKRVLSSNQKLSNSPAGGNNNQATNKSQGSDNSGDRRAVWENIPFLKNLSRTNSTFIVVYILIWATLVLDVILKTLVVTTSYPVLFDGAVTLIELSLRSAANLSFGTTIKSAMNGAQAVYEPQQPQSNAEKETAATTMAISQSRKLESNAV